MERECMQFSTLAKSLERIFYIEMVLSKKHPTYEFITGKYYDEPPSLCEEDFKPLFSLEQDALWVLDMGTVVKCKIPTMMLYPGLVRN